MERCLDVIFSGLALLILFPLLVPIIIILRCTAEGEVLFLQKRVGRNGEIFKLYKFVTMLKDSPKMGTGTITIKDDPRILPVGIFLRKTKINELPQLLNIFFGDMSVIGPRPLTEQTFSSYSAVTQNVIKQVRPGLSGVGSIIFRGEEKLMQGANASVDFYDRVIAPYKGELEEWFVANKSLYVYFMAILITIWAVLFPQSTIAWRVFEGLPEPTEELKLPLNWRP